MSKLFLIFTSEEIKKPFFMQVLLEVNDKQSDFAMSVFRSLEFVKKGETVSDSKAAFIKDLKLAMKEVALAKRGKIKLKSAEQLINEL